MGLDEDSWQEKREEADFLKEWVERLKDCNKAIVVEGKNDIRALRIFGIKHIFQIDEAIYSLSETIAYKFKNAVILTDFDKAGKSLYGKLKTDLTRLGVQIDNTLREELYKNTKLTQIEGFDSYFERVVGWLPEKKD